MANPQDQSRKGTGFTNLQRYLEAGKKNKLGSVIGEGISTSAEGARTALGGATQQFQAGAQAGTVGSEQDRSAREAALQRISQGNTEIESPVVQQFQTFREGQYKGPRELENVYNLTNQARQAEQLGKNVGSDTGRGALLQQFVGDSRYGGGKQRLDTLLLGQSPNLSQARQKTVGLTSAVGRENQRAGAEAVQKQATAKQFAQETGTRLDENVEAIAKPIIDPSTGRVQEYLGKQNDYITKLQDALSTGKLDPSMIQALGLAPGQTLYKVGEAVTRDPKQFYTKGSIAPETVITTQEAAKLAALSKLSGKAAPIKSGVPAYDPSNPVAFTNKVKEYLARQDTDYKAAVAQASPEIAQLFPAKTPASTTPKPTVKLTEDIAVPAGVSMSLPQAKDHLMKSRELLQQKRRELDSRIDPDVENRGRSEEVLRGYEDIKRYDDYLNQIEQKIQAKEQALQASFGANTRVIG